MHRFPEAGAGACEAGGLHSVLEQGKEFGAKSFSLLAML